MTRTKTKRRPHTTKAPARALLPVRTAPAPAPEFITDGQIHAHYEAQLAGLPHTPITAWTALPDGTHTVRFPTGAHLTHTVGTTEFTAHTPCPQGAHHQAVISNGRQLEGAVRTAGQCTHPHGTARILTLPEAAATAEETQQLSHDDITTGLTARAAVDTEQPKEHPHG